MRAFMELLEDRRLMSGGGMSVLAEAAGAGATLHKAAAPKPIVGE